MNALKRVWFFVLGVAGLATLFCLGLPWVGGPLARTGAGLFQQLWYLYLVEGCAAITAVGSIISLGRSILTPRNSKTVVVSKSNGDQVTVATAAISSQAAHVIEQDHDYFAEKVWVSARRSGHVRVKVRVRPAHAVDVTVEGKRLHDLLMAELSKTCGKAIDKIELEFVQPDSLDPKPEYLNASSTSSVEDASWESTSWGSSSDSSLGSEITVPVTSMLASSSSSESQEN